EPVAAELAADVPPEAGVDELDEQAVSPSTEITAAKAAEVPLDRNRLLPDMSRSSERTTVAVP
ncbi:MAG: hypothetical protein QOE24_2791, partial [Frankiales bacterium]|nr:hypothetical protein [Frankiales bacterium]